MRKTPEQLTRELATTRRELAEWRNRAIAAEYRVEQYEAANDKPRPYNDRTSDTVVNRATPRKVR